MISALIFAAMLAQGGGPHFSDDPDQVSTPGASQTAQAAAPAPVPKVASVEVIAPARPPASTDDDKTDPISCQHYATTGTRFTTKYCLRQSQWAELARRGKEEMDDLQFKGGWGIK